jgi:hypothetical protein
MRSLQALITRPEQFACSETNTGALIACSAAWSFRRQIPCRCLPKCAEEKEHSPTDFLLGKYRRGGFKVRLFVLLLVLLFVSFSRFWQKNDEKEAKRSAKRNAKRLTLNDTNDVRDCHNLFPSRHFHASPPYVDERVLHGVLF